MSQPQAKADALVLTERIPASPETIFDFLIDPDKLLRWMGTAVDIDPRPGGLFWLNVTGTDIATGTYIEVDPPHKVVFTWGWQGSEDVPPGSSTVTFALRSDGDDTILELRHDGLPGGAADDHGKGWAYFLTTLVAVSVGEEPGPDLRS